MANCAASAVRFNSLAEVPAFTGELNLAAGKNSRTVLMTPFTDLQSAAIDHLPAPKGQRRGQRFRLFYDPIPLAFRFVYMHVGSISKTSYTVEAGWSCLYNFFVIISCLMLSSRFAATCLQLGTTRSQTGTRIFRTKGNPMPTNSSRTCERRKSGKCLTIDLSWRVTKGLGELRWTSEKKEHRLVGFLQGGAFFAVMGCTHKGQIYDPADALDQAKKRKSQIQTDKAITVEYDL